VDVGNGWGRKGKRDNRIQNLQGNSKVKHYLIGKLAKKMVVGGNVVVGLRKRGHY